MRAVTYRSGPLVWCVILLATCLLLFLLQKILWLVVPFIFGLIAYYLLFPLQQCLVLSGLSREVSAALMSSGALLLMVGLVALMLPWISSHLGSWQTLALLYAEGGLRLVSETLIVLEQSYSFAARAHISDQWSNQLVELGGLAGFGDKLARVYLAEAVLTAVAWLPSLLLALF